MYKTDVNLSFCEIDNRLTQLEENYNKKQDELISGLNIKTINNLSLIGKGNINTKSKDLINYYTKNEINNILANMSPGTGNIRHIVIFDCNERDYVDLGLPSGTLWSTENLEGYYLFGKLETIEVTKNTPPYSGPPGIIDKEYDVINHELGGDWRLPTKEQFLELIENTTSRFIRNYHGKNGMMFESPNGNFIFFPDGGLYLNTLRNKFNGYYWTCDKENDGASAFSYSLNGEKSINIYDVSDGLQVRGVITPVIINFLDLFNKEDKSNKITNLSAESTDIEYPSARAVVNALTELDNKKLDKEIDPIFTASIASTIKSEDIQSWNNKVDSSDLSSVAISGNYNDLNNKPNIPLETTESTITNWGFTKNTGTVTGVIMNGILQGTSGIVNLGTILTTHLDISNKANKSEAIGSLTLSLDSTNYKIILSGTKVDGTTFTVSNVIDLPLESVVVSGSYNDTTKKVILTLQNGSTINFSVADLIAGLLSEITSTNKLSADLIADGNTNKTVTQAEKTTWNNKGTYSKPSGGIPASDLASGVIPDTNNFIEESDLASVAFSGSYDDLINTPSVPAAQVNSDWNAMSGVAEILNKPTIPTVPTNVSAFTNDAGYLTQHQSLNDYATQTWVGQQGYLTQHQDITGKEDTANKVTSWQSTPDNTHYPSEKLVKDSIDGVDNVFVAKFGVTTGSDVTAAINAGKAVFCVREARVHHLSITNGDWAYFGGNGETISLKISTSLWSRSTGDVENTNNKKFTITGNATSDTYYPTTKAVADYVSGIVGDINSILDQINGEVI